MTPANWRPTYTVQREFLKFSLSLSFFVVLRFEVVGYGGRIKRNSRDSWVIGFKKWLERRCLWRSNQLYFFVGWEISVYLHGFIRWWGKFTFVSYFNNSFKTIITIANNCSGKWPRLYEKWIDYNSYEWTKFLISYFFKKLMSNSGMLG